MRKKYLSALLFGALLFASAGTFTSCKDYDDDIDNLQSQIDKVVSDLASLKSTVDNLNVGVTSVTVDGDQLVVVTNGATTKMNLPVGVQVSEIEIKDGHLYVGGVDKGAIDAPATPTEKAQKVEVKEDGFLYIDDVKQDGLHVGTDVVIKDASNGIYTITIGKETIQLPMASSAITAVTLTGGTKISSFYVFTQKYGGTLSSFAQNEGICWGTAAAAIDDWTGTLGAISKDQLLVGPISTVQVTVNPLNADLSTAKLTLVDAKGDVAAANVTAKAVNADPSYTSGRAIDPKGQFNLSVQLTANADKMGSAYAKSDNTANKLYALAVDGKIMTPYQIAIDTRTDAEITSTIGSNAATWINSNLLINGTAYAGSAVNPKVGDNTFAYNAPAICDMQIDIATESIDDAALLGITLDKATNTLKVPASAAGKSANNVKLNIKILRTNGKVTSISSPVTLGTVGQVSDIESTQTLATTNYTLVANSSAYKKDFLINLEDVFTSLPEAQSTALTSTDWTVDNGFVLSSLAYNSTIKYYASEADAKDYDNDKSINIDDAAIGSRVRNIKYARVMVSSYASTATEGTHNLKLTLKTAAGEIKKVTVPVQVTAPAFTDIYPKSANWNGDTFSVTLLNETGNKKLDYGTAFNPTSGTSRNSINIAAEVVSDNTSLFAANAALDAQGKVATTNAIVKNNKLTKTEVKTTVSYKFSDNIKVSYDFTTEIHSIFENPSLVYYQDGVEVDKAKVGEEGLIAPLSFDATTGAPVTGLGIKYGSGLKPFKYTTVVDGITINSSASGSGQVKATGTVENVAAAGVSINTNGTTITGVNTGKLIITFEDANTVQTTASIEFVK